MWKGFWKSLLAHLFEDEVPAWMAYMMMLFGIILTFAVFRAVRPLLIERLSH
ncbi:hypothetical protein [Methylorubrum sp. SB2]|uniref:hypothetical protein n=1 Tax=Methylorubrum subtropicum TaxID=3138812 RepID=UPI00313C9A5B